MRIGYIILCYKHPELVARVAKTLTRNTDNIVILHVDKKVNETSFRNIITESNQVVFMKNRESIYWGGFNSIAATINCLKLALTFDCDRYILLQGMDYPIHSNKYINDFFENHREVEFLKGYNITNSPRKLHYMKCYGYHFFDYVDREKFSIRTFFARSIEFCNKFGLKYRKGFYYDNRTKTKYDIYWGWGHFALTKPCVQYIVNFYDENQRFNKYFKTIFPPDETYIHTLIYNSSFADKTLNQGPMKEKDYKANEDMLNLTYFEYPGKVRVFKKIDDITKIDRNKYLFLRKVKNDSQLLKQIDDYRDKELKKVYNCEK